MTNIIGQVAGGTISNGQGCYGASLLPDTFRKVLLTLAEDRCASKQQGSPQKTRQLVNVQHVRLFYVPKWHISPKLCFKPTVCWSHFYSSVECYIVQAGFIHHDTFMMHFRYKLHFFVTVQYIFLYLPRQVFRLSLNIAYGLSLNMLQV